MGFEFIDFQSCKGETSYNEWRANLLEGRSRFVHSVQTSSASLNIKQCILTIHAIIQDIMVYYKVVWYKVIQFGTLHSIQLHLEIIHNTCQHIIQSYWVNTSAGTTFCHKTSLLPEFCKAGHVLATVMGMRSHMRKFYS